MCRTTSSSASRPGRPPPASTTPRPASDPAAATGASPPRTMGDRVEAAYLGGHLYGSRIMGPVTSDTHRQIASSTSASTRFWKFGRDGGVDDLYLYPARSRGSIRPGFQAAPLPPGWRRQGKRRRPSLQHGLGPSWRSSQLKKLEMLPRIPDFGGGRRYDDVKTMYGRVARKHKRTGRAQNEYPDPVWKGGSPHATILRRATTARASQSPTLREPP
jgi:hypothetical protein